MALQYFSVDVVIPHYNNWSALATLAELMEGWAVRYPRLRILIIDDGSRNPDEQLLAAVAKKPQVTIIRHTGNRGRAAALNTGIRNGESDFVVFLDVDCRPQDGWLDHFFTSAESGADCVFGNLKAEGTTYWSRYLNQLYDKKAQSYLCGGRDFNTPFCMFRRKLLDQIGGFNEEYTGYGFEDRDLIQSLFRSGEIPTVFLSSVSAVHSAPSGLESVLTKAVESGVSSSQIFSRRFPESYRASSYWYFDAREHSFIYCLPLVAGWQLMAKNFFCVRSLIEKEAMPYTLWKLLVKLSTGLAFFEGTRRSMK